MTDYNRGWGALEDIGHDCIPKSQTTYIDQPAALAVTDHIIALERQRDELLAACESHGDSCGLAKDGPNLLEVAAETLELAGLAGLSEPLRIKARLERAAIARIEEDVE